LDRVFTDAVSGKSTTRPQLQAMLAFVRDGDTVIVHSMDRLARNLDDLRLVRELTGRRGGRPVHQRAADLHCRGCPDGYLAAVRSLLDALDEPPALEGVPEWLICALNHQSDSAQASARNRRSARELLITARCATLPMMRMRIC
jgi:hypothetical protein